MNDRRQLIAEAITLRYQELCERRITSLSPGEFAEHSGFVSRVKKQFADASTKPFDHQVRPPDSWQQSESSGMPVLQALVLGELAVTSEVAMPSVDEFLGELKSARKNHSRSLELLLTRYACPINFSCAGEGDVRELVLEGLMVRDRRKIEEASLSSADNDHLWYRLNLIAIQSRASDDLRFLDALNYYFELIPDDWRSRAQNKWLFVSYLALYARALAAKCEDFKCE